MPVTHQWKSKPKPEVAPPAAESQSPPQQPATTGKKGAPQAAAAEESSVGKKGSSAPSRWSRKDEKPPAKTAPPEKDDDDDDEEDDDEEEGESNQPGRIRNLAGFFATQRDEPKTVKKKRFEVTDAEDAIVAENEPEERLEGVIRADDPGEWEKPIELEKGWAKNMANLFLNRQQQETGSTSKKPFVMDIEEGAQTIVLENEPVILEGVVRSVDKTEDVIGKRGRIKNIAGRFANPQSDDATDGSSSSYWRDPADLDSGRTRNVADRWKNQRFDDDDDDAPSSPTSTGKPKWMVELESAKEYGVFENEPEVRSDVVRADDEQPDVISAQHTRNLRKMWSQIERDEGVGRDAAAPSRRSDIVIRPKKKEPSPEPEPPPPPPVEETKPTRRFGGVAAGKVGGGPGKFASVYGRQAKKEKTPPPPEPEPEPPPKPVTRRGFRQTFLPQPPAQPPAPAAAAPEPPPATPPTPDPKNPFKRSLKPVPRRK